MTSGCTAPSSRTASATVPATPTDRMSLGALISGFRWAGVMPSPLLPFFVPPVPLSRPAALGVTLAIALYNLPASLVGRLGPRLVEPSLVLGLAGDFCACTAWLLLTGGDTQTTFLIYTLVAIEAAAAYGWIGAGGVFLGVPVVRGARGV